MKRYLPAFWERSSRVVLYPENLPYSHRLRAHTRRSLSFCACEWYHHRNLRRYLGQISKLFKKLKNQLNSRFRMKDLGPVAWYLGMQITRDRINQSTCIKRAIEDRDMVSCNPVSTPMDAGYVLKKDGENLKM